MKLLGWLGDGPIFGTPIYGAGGGGGPGGIIISILVIIGVPVAIIALVLSLIAYPFRAGEHQHYAELRQQVEKVQSAYTDRFEKAGWIDVDRRTRVVNSGFADEYEETYINDINLVARDQSYISKIHVLLVSIGREPVLKKEVDSSSVARSESSVGDQNCVSIDTGAAVWDYSEYHISSVKNQVGSNSGYLKAGASPNSFEGTVPILQKGDTYSMYFAHVMGLRWNGEYWRYSGDEWPYERYIHTYNRVFGTSLSLFTSTKEDFKEQTGSVKMKKAIDKQSRVTYSFDVPEDMALASWLYGDIPEQQNLDFFITSDASGGLKEYFDERPVDDATWQKLVAGTFVIG